MSIRSRIANLIMGDEMRRLQSAFATMREAYEVGPYQLPPAELARQLKEQDPGLLQDMIDQLQWETFGVGSTTLDAERTRAIDESIRAYRRDVVTEFGVGLWTDFGFGETVRVRAVDEAAQEVWNEFFTATRNAEVLSDDKIHRISETLLVQGEVFPTMYVSTADGQCTIRLLGSESAPGTKQITQLIAAANDETIPLFYLREWTDGNSQRQQMYYANWRAYLDGLLDKAQLKAGISRSDSETDGTIAVMIQWAHNCKGGLRGWPLNTVGLPWSRSHKKFREDRTAAAAAIAMFVNKIKVKGGSRAVAAEYGRLASGYQQSGNYGWDTNPPPVAGSTRIENEASTFERLPMGSGASDAKTDGEALLQMAGLGIGVYPHWLGAGDAYRLATATSMDTPMQRKFSRYQTFWSCQFRHLVDLVLSMAEKFGGKSFASHKAEVSMDQLVQSDLPGIAQSMTALIDSTMAAIEKGAANGAPVPAILSAIWKLSFDALGIQDQDALNAQAFGAQEKVPEQVKTAIEAACQNYREGKVTADALVVYLMAELIEGSNGNKEAQSSILSGPIA